MCFLRMPLWRELFKRKRSSEPVVIAKEGLKERNKGATDPLERCVKRVTDCAISMTENAFAYGTYMGQTIN